MFIRNECKQDICDKLLETLWETRAGSEVESLTYIDSRGDEYVRISYKDGHGALACVTGDSGVSLIRDVLGKIC